MQNITDFENALNAREGVLLSKNTVSRHKAKDRLLASAQCRAKKIVAEAQIEAEELLKHAYSSGYEAGFLSSAEAVAAFFSDSNTMCQKVYSSLEQDLRDMLSSVLHHSDTFPILLTNWLQEINIDSGESHTLFILLPESMKIHKKELMRRLECFWECPIVVQYHDKTHFVMKCHNQLAEFSPDSIINDGVKNILSKKFIHREYEVLSQQSLVKLQELLSVYIDCSFKKPFETSV